MLLEKIEVHTTLNPKIWSKDNKLLPGIKDRLLEIRDEFLEEVAIPLNIIDIELVGSNASYNYNNHSDFDMHLIVNFDDYNASQEIVQALYDLEKSKFNKNFDIKIKGIPVEIYVQDVNSSTKSNGIYSLYNDMWVKEPIPITHITEYDFSDDVKEFKQKVEDVLDIDEAQKMLDELYLMRKRSLDIEGEYGRGNQLFKELRNLELIQQLRDKIIDLKSKKLTLEQQIVEELNNYWFI